MAESVDLDVLVAGDFRGRQPSFHSVHSFQQKVAAKRPAAAPLDCQLPHPSFAQYERRDYTLLSVRKSKNTLFWRFMYNLSISFYLSDNSSYFRVGSRYKN